MPLLTDEYLVYDKIRSEKKDIVHLCADTGLRFKSIARALIKLRKEDRINIYPNIFTKTFKGKRNKEPNMYRGRRRNGSGISPGNFNVIGVQIGILYSTHLSNMAFSYPSDIIKSILDARRDVRENQLNSDFWVLETQSVDRERHREFANKVRSFPVNNSSLTLSGLIQVHCNWPRIIGWNGEDRIDSLFGNAGGQIESTFIINLFHRYLSSNYEFVQNEDLTSSIQVVFKMKYFMKFLKKLIDGIRSRNRFVMEDSFLINCYLLDSRNRAFKLSSRGLDYEYIKQDLYAKLLGVA